jgi:hypothetical protein
LNQSRSRKEELTSFHDGKFGLGALSFQSSILICNSD